MKSMSAWLQLKVLVMAFTVNIAGDITASTLEGFVRDAKPEDILRFVQNKPLLKKLMAAKKEYGSAGPASGGTAPPNIREPVMGALMRDQNGFYAGIADDDVLAFKSSDGAVQTTCPIRWMHAGFQITHDELASQGVHIAGGQGTNITYTKDEANCLFDALELKRADYMESIMFARNNTLWLDGTQDAKAIPGIKSILTDDPTTGTVLGVARTNVWWRHVADTGVGGAGPKLAFSKADQTLTERLDKVISVILRRYNGNPNVALAGSDLIDAVKREQRAKGLYTQEGFSGKQDLSAYGTGRQPTGVWINGLFIEFDPTLDLLGESKRIYIWDDAHLKLRPQKKEWGKVTNQNQPSDQFVMLISTTDRGAITCNQMDCNYVGEMA
jgi:hypothetical protein